jgi:hypothetical protein
MPKTILACLVVTLSFAGTAHSQVQRDHPKHSAQAPTDKPRGTTEAPIFVKVLPSAPSKEQLDREAHDRQEKAVNDRDLVYWTEVLGKATVFLAFATVVLMVFTGLNLLILKAQGRDLEKQRSVMQRQAEHLEEQAVQLKASVAQIKDTADHQLRAYVTVRTGRIWHEMRAFGWHLEWVPVVINVGQTPAYNVQLCVKTAIRPEPLPDGTDLMAEVPLTGVGSRGDLGPTQAFYPPSWLNYYVPDERMEGLKAAERKEAFYVWGLVTYRDIFKKEHRTKFCFVADYDNEGSEPSSHGAPPGESFRWG